MCITNPGLIREDNGEGTDENANGNQGWWVGKWVTQQIALYQYPDDIREYFIDESG